MSRYFRQVLIFLSLLYLLLKIGFITFFYLISISFEVFGLFGFFFFLQTDRCCNCRTRRSTRVDLKFTQTRKFNRFASAFSSSSFFCCFCNHYDALCVSAVPGPFLVSFCVAQETLHRDLVGAASCLDSSASTLPPSFVGNLKRKSDCNVNKKHARVFAGDKAGGSDGVEKAKLRDPFEFILGSLQRLTVPFFVFVSPLVGVLEQQVWGQWFTAGGFSAATFFLDHEVVAHI